MTPDDPTWRPGPPTGPGLHQYGAYPTTPDPDPYQQTPPGAPQGRPARVPWGRIAAVAGLIGLLAGIVAAAVTTIAVDAVDPGPVVAAPVPDGEVAGGSGENPVVGVASAVLPGVVSIDVRGTTSEVTGSGFVYDDAGHVVTNNHVVEGAGTGTIQVITSDGSSTVASVVGTSPAYDLAVLRLKDAQGLAPLAVGNSDQVKVGQSVVAVGSPLGLDATVTSGIISALDRPVTAGSTQAASYIDALQTDASINPGNSGGPLVDLNGRVIGVNSAIATLGASSNQGGSVGLGFAIPINQVRRTVGQIIETGRARYPVIGARVSVQRATGGAVVRSVSPDSPARQAGLQTGDRIVEVEGTPVADGVELIVQIRTYAPGQRISLSYLRDGDRRSVEVTLDGQVG